MENASESLAALRILVAVAQADGDLAEVEKETIRTALGGMPLPDGVTVDALLDERVDVSTTMAKITTPDLREQTFRAAWAVAYADKQAHPEEIRILEGLQQAWRLEQPKPGILSHVWSGSGGLTTAIPDPAQRSEKIKKDVLRYSIIAAGLGAFPIPVLSLFCDGLILVMQRRLVVGIAGYHGKQLDNKEAAAMFGTLLGSASLRTAVTSLVKFVPGWGSVVGATTGFATTYALGQVLSRHFDSGEKLSPEELKQEFAAAKQEGETEYKEHKDEISAAAKAKEGQIQALTSQLKDGKITEAELEAKLGEL
jgi:uncharacterized protein (DUF697 family)